MSTFRVHTVDSAPQGSQEALNGLRQSIGTIPNLAASMAESPELLRGFLAIREILYRGSFTPAEVQVLALTNAFENGCRYCMALHSTFALKAGVPPAAVQALRRGDSPEDSKLGTLSGFSRKLVRARGRVGADDLRAFLAAGYSKGQALEVVLGVAVSILPNFAHHLTECPIDEAFQGQLWTDPRQ
jgi:AhpD family alkylhydroperoxidase